MEQPSSMSLTSCGHTGDEREGGGRREGGEDRIMWERTRHISIMYVMSSPWCQPMYSNRMLRHRAALMRVRRYT